MRNVSALACVAVLVSGCSPTTPSSSSTCVSKGSMGALIDGVAWTASCVDIAVHNTDLGYLEIQGGTADPPFTQRVQFVCTPLSPVRM